MKGILYGVGVNDANYKITTVDSDGVAVRCKAYIAWANILTRCFSKVEHERRPTYANTTICDEWLSFMNFRGWWLSNYVEGYHLDKDLLTDDREYGPESCIYVPSWINTFTLDCNSTRGDLPIGSYFNKQHGLFYAQCRNPKTGKRESLGRYATAEQASDVWRSRKLSLSAELKPSMDLVDSRIYPRVVEIVLRAK